MNVTYGVDMQHYSCNVRAGKVFVAALKSWASLAQCNSITQASSKILASLLRTLGECWLARMVRPLVIAALLGALGTLAVVSSEADPVVNLTSKNYEEQVRQAQRRLDRDCCTGGGR